MKDGTWLVDDVADSIARTWKALEGKAQLSRRLRKAMMPHEAKLFETLYEGDVSADLLAEALSARGVLQKDGKPVSDSAVRSAVISFLGTRREYKQRVAADLAQMAPVPEASSVPLFASLRVVPKEAETSGLGADIEPAAGREPTQSQRVQIRKLLDEHFDEALGAYRDGQSDQKIGTEVGVSQAAVAKIREAAYGPIRVDSEAAQLRDLIKQHEARHAADVAELRRQLDALTEKRAVA